MKNNSSSPQTANENEKIKVLVVGDSELQRMKSEKLSNYQRDVEIKFTRGMKIKQAAQRAGNNNRNQ